MLTDVRGFGCGCCAPAAFGDDEPAITTAITSAAGAGAAQPATFPFKQLFLVSVAAGCTVFFLTRIFGRRS